MQSDRKVSAVIQTSAGDPLRIDALPAGAGTLGLTFCPGKQRRGASGVQWARDLDADLDAIAGWHAHALVTLNEAHELPALQVAQLPERLGLSAFGWHHLPIPDGGVPDALFESAWQSVGAELRHRLRRGERIVIHCKGGLGRTGTLAARLLVELGMPAEEAIDRVRVARPGAIENDAQAAHVLSATPVSDPALALLSRARGCLLGGALGDALGAPVEFLPREAMLAAHGAAGVRTLLPAYGRRGAITDDTQITLFCADGLLAAWHAGGRAGIDDRDVVVALWRAYLRWLATQGSTHDALISGGWLLALPALQARRAPGMTCLSALQVSGEQRLTARNTSKGCGGVMRVAPIGLLLAAMHPPSNEEALRRAFALGCADAAITHGHPSGRLAAGVMAATTCQLARGLPLAEAAQRALQPLRAQPRHEETLALATEAIALARHAPMTHAALARLGQGWTAEEALAIGLYCALGAEQTGASIEDALSLAVTHDGDSDSTGAIAGQLLGACRGEEALPIAWLAELELADVIAQAATELCAAPALTAAPGAPIDVYRRARHVIGRADTH